MISMGKRLALVLAGLVCTLPAKADELRADRSKRKLAAAVTLYHLVVEASLAQPGQHMIEAYLEEYDVLYSGPSSAAWRRPSSRRPPP